MVNLKTGWINYCTDLVETLRNFSNDHEIEKLAEFLWQSLEGNNEVHVIGNGGSAANAHHIVGDYTKTFCLYQQKLKISSISDNGCYMTAISNDIDYSQAYSFLIPNRISEKDLIIFLSGSGNSSNLVKCALKAKKFGILTSSLTGYEGGKLSQICDIPIKFQISDMEIAEDLQLIVFHYLKQYLCERLVEQKKIIPITSPKYVRRIASDEVT